MDKIHEKLKNDPTLAIRREAFRKSLSDLGHVEATVYSHWALEAFDIAFGLRAYQSLQGKINKAVWNNLWPNFDPEARIAPMDIVEALNKDGLKIVEK